MAKLEVTVVSGKKSVLGTFVLSTDTSIAELKRCFHQRHPKWPPDQQSFSIGEGRGRVALRSGKLGDFGLKDGATVTFKNRGTRIGWTTVFLIQNLGPLLCHVLAFCYPESIYDEKSMPKRSYLQTVAFYLMVLHFTKQIFETLFVHRFRRERIGFSELISNSVQFTIFGGAAIAYYVYHPLYTPRFENRNIINAFAVAFAACEIGSLQSHLLLRSLRKGDDKSHKIPKGGLFTYVSCPNYTLESLSWLVYSTMISCLTATGFFVVVTFQLLLAASKKHRQYKRDFPDYPRKRVPMFMFIPAIGRERRQRRPTGPEVGVVFPEDNKGVRSTTAAGKAILIAGLRNVEAHETADAVTRERNWRYQYHKYYMNMVEISAESPEKSLGIARAALRCAHSSFEFITSDGEKMPFDEAMKSIKGSFETGIIRGNVEKPKEFVLKVPYKNGVLSGSELRSQLDKWRKYGTMELDCATAIQTVSSKPQWLDLSDRYFVLIGAGSAMGPFIKLLELGANIVAVDIPKRERLWEKLITTARNSPGTLYFPLSKPQNEMKDDDELFISAGCDLLKQPAEILNWILELSKGPLKGSPLTIGNYTYLDGGLHVKLSLAADAIIEGLCEQLKGTIVAFLCTPTDIHAIPSDAHRDAERRNGWHIGKPIELLINFLSGGSELRKNALKPLKPKVGSSIHRVDGMSVAQGPNYALAKRMQHWRAMIAFEDGCTVSANIAPSTATVSVLHNKQFAWAYSGMPYFKPFEIFQQETTNALMAALLIHDVQNVAGPKNPENRERFGIENPLSLFSHQGLHGGLWRCAYKVDSIGFTSVLIHFLGGPKLFLPIVSAMLVAPLVVYQCVF